MNERDLLQAGFRYALSLRPAWHDAEDLVQEAWYRLHRRFGGVAGKPLLFTAIRNIHVDRARRDRLVLFEPLDDLRSVPGENPDVAERAVAARDLEAPLAALRAEEREALFLNVVEGYSAAEIAALTGRPRGTVLSLVHRAREKLRRALSADAEPGEAYYGGSKG
jgi:RNA polymerase sigma-70 factor (ECF subfamily)